MTRITFSSLLIFACAGWAVGQPQDYHLPSYEVIPLADQQVSLQIHAAEKTRWHFGSQYPRPFFFPLNGASGTSLTRMGHPGAQDHDHHRSIWFAFHDVEGLSFWSDSSGTVIRQKHWYRYLNGDDEAIMSSALGWYRDDKLKDELLEQDLVAAIYPNDSADADVKPSEDYCVELQLTFRPGTGRQQVVLGKTNFGFLAVRVSHTLSAYFGGGTITDSEGRIDEPEIFGKAAKWVDYSGPVSAGVGTDRRIRLEGITYFDHPSNPRYPTKWHVRRDGWMGASFCMDDSWTVTQEKPLTLRYMLLVHTGKYDEQIAEDTHSAFSKKKGFRIRPRNRDEPHRQYEVERIR